MTNKERYKQAFSALHTSGQSSMEVEKMADIKKKHKRNTVAAAAVACAVVIGGSVTAYAADIGGIQEKVSIWKYGKKVEAEIEENSNGGYTIRYECNDEEQGLMRLIEVSTGPDWISSGLSADELVAAINDSIDVYEDVDGSVWVYYYDQKADITDLFDAEGVCRVTMTYEGQAIYLEIKRGKNGDYTYSQKSDLPKDEIEKYVDILLK